MSSKLLATTVYLLRHAESAPSREIPEPEWPLSEAGRAQAVGLVDTLRPFQIDRICSSPFPRAIETVRPFSELSGIEVEVVAGLREKKLTDRFLEDWEATLRRSWEDLTFALPNCESGRDCQERVARCLEGLVESYRGMTILAASHGNAIGLLLNRLDGAFGFEAWSGMGNPDLFRIVYDGGAPRWDRSFVYRRREP